MRQPYVQTTTSPSPPPPLEPDFLDGDHNVLPSFASIRAKNLQILYGKNAGADKSPKGSVDHPIRDLVNLINSHPSFVTLSSCSGRIVLFDPNGASGATTTIDNHASRQRQRQQNDPPVERSNSSSKGGQWLIANHEKLDFESLCQVISNRNQNGNHLDNDNVSSSTGDTEDSIPLLLQDSMSFRFEPMLLHVAASTLERGQQLLQIALQQGYRESGLIVTTTKAASQQRITVAIRSYSLALVVPVVPFTSTTGRNHCFSMTYWHALVQEANRRLELNRQRLHGLYDAIVKGTFRHRPQQEFPLASAALMHAESLPILRVWGHAGIAIPLPNDGLDIVVFGGYGSGPQTRDDDKNNNNKVSCKRLDTIYHLCRSKGRWSRQWDRVVVETHPVETFRGLFVRPGKWTAREGASCCRVLRWDRITEDSRRIGGVMFGGRRGPACPLDDLMLFEYCSNDDSTARCRFYQATQIRGKHPTARWGHTLTSVQESCGENHYLAVLIGGRNESSVVSDCIYILSEHSSGVDGATCLQWEQVILPGESIQRFHHGSVAIQNTVFVFGGLRETNNVLEMFGDNHCPPMTPVFCFTVSSKPARLYVRGTDYTPRLFGLSSCLMPSSLPPENAVDTDEYHILLSGGICGSEAASELGTCLSVLLLSRKMDAWEISVLQQEVDMTRVKNLGPLVHHQCFSLVSSNDDNPQMVSVGGGASGFAFRPTFSASFALSRRLSERGVSFHQTSGQRANAQKSTSAGHTALPETTDVIYVRKKDAKFVKTLLEQAALLNKSCRMCPADVSAAADLRDPSSCVAIPIDGIDMTMLDKYQNSPATVGTPAESLIASWASLVVGLGRQKAPRSTATFARHSKAKR